MSKVPIQNQGFRLDLNLQESNDDDAAWDNLYNPGISKDLAILVNNLRNTSILGPGNTPPVVISLTTNEINDANYGVNNVNTKAPHFFTSNKSRKVTNSITLTNNDKSILTGDNIISYEVTTQATRGTATINAGGVWEYEPNNNEDGIVNKEDSFTVTIIDNSEPANTLAKVITTYISEWELTDSTFTNDDTIQVNEEITFNVGERSGDVATGQRIYTTPGTHSWTCPPGVTSVSVVCVGGGGGGQASQEAFNATSACGGAGGGLGYKNNISVTPLQSYTLVVGAGGDGLSGGDGASNTLRNGSDSYFIDTSTVKGGGGNSANSVSNSVGGTYTGDGGGNGGKGNIGAGYAGGGGGGAGGYSGNGGDAVIPTPNTTGTPGNDGQGGAGGSGGGGVTGNNASYDIAGAGGGGGGVGLLGQGSNGAGGTGGKTNTLTGVGLGGGGGSGGQSGALIGLGYQGQTLGATYGGGGGGGGSQFSSPPYDAYNGADGGHGAVRIIWGVNRTFPLTNTADQPTTAGTTANGSGTVGSLSTETLIPNKDYYVCSSNARNGFKISTTPSGDTVGVSTIPIISVNSNNGSFTSTFGFIRKDAVTAPNLTAFIKPEVLDEDFSYLGDTGINGSFSNNLTAYEYSEFLIEKKYKTNKDILSDRDVKFEGSVRVKDPQGYNDGATALNATNPDGTPDSPGIFIGNTRAFSTDNNPWEKDVSLFSTKSHSDEFTIGDLEFGGVIDASGVVTAGQIKIKGLNIDGTEIVDITASDSKLVNKLSGSNPNVYKFPMIINGETYYILVERE